MGYKARLFDGAFCLEARAVKCASVVELVYTADLKSVGVSLAGSSPATRTKSLRKGAREAPFCCPAENLGATARVERVPAHWNATMRYSLFDGQRDAFILIARVLLMILFVVSGWAKLTGFDGTVAYMTSLGAPAPMLAAAIAVLMEFFVGIVLILGFYTRPLAFLFALFVLGTALIGHPFWNMVDPERSANMTQFLKNLSIIGGLLLLAVSGPGRFSLDRR